MQSNGSRGGRGVILRRDRGHRRWLLDLRRRNTKRPRRKLRQRPKHGSGESIMTIQTWPRLPLDLVLIGQVLQKSDKLVEHIGFCWCQISEQDQPCMSRPFPYKVKLHTRRHLPQSQSRYCQTFDHQIFYRRRLRSPDVTSEIWLQEAIAQTKTQSQGKKRVHASKASPHIWIRCPAKLTRTGLEIKNDYCSGIRCGLGQSDDGAGGGNVRSWDGMVCHGMGGNLNRVSHGQISYQIQPSGPHALSGLKTGKGWFDNENMNPEKQVI